MGHLVSLGAVDSPVIFSGKEYCKGIKKIEPLHIYTDSNQKSIGWLAWQFKVGTSENTAQILYN